MLNSSDILETIKMIQEENLDIRTITMGISLLDCIDSDIDKACDKVYDKIMRKAENLVKTHQCQILAGLGLVELDLGRKILTLGIQHVDIRDDTVNVLAIGQCHILGSGIFHLRLYLRVRTGRLVHDSGIVNFPECLNHTLLILKSSLLVHRNRCLHRALQFSEIDDGSDQIGPGEPEWRLQEILKFAVFQSYAQVYHEGRVSLGDGDSHAGFRSPGVCHTAATAAMQPRMWTLGNTLVLVSME